MSVELKVYTDDANQFDDLRGWLTGQHPGIVVTAVPKAPEPYAQGSLWDFLEVACTTGGAGTAAVHALTQWIKSRVSAVRIEVGEAKFVVEGPAAEAIMPEVAELVRALERARDDDRA